MDTVDVVTRDRLTVAMVDLADTASAPPTILVVVTEAMVVTVDALHPLTTVIAVAVAPPAPMGKSFSLFLLPCFCFVIMIVIAASVCFFVVLLSSLLCVFLHRYYVVSLHVLHSLITGVTRRPPTLDYQCGTLVLKDCKDKEQMDERQKEGILTGCLSGVNMTKTRNWTTGEVACLNRDGTLDHVLYFLAPCISFSFLFFLWAHMGLAFNREGRRADSERKNGITEYRKE